MTIKKQLNKFYDAQGLTGKHRRKAMQYDMKAVRDNILRDTCGYRTASLQSAFYWAATPQGHEYWEARR